MTARGLGHGKLLLCGEHAVVYGHPAIATAVDLCTRVTLEPVEGATRVVSRPADDRLQRALCSVVPTEGWQVAIETDLPIGRGMGSSAALAVAVVRAMAAARGRVLDPRACYAEAMQLERVFHGNPSGVDIAVSSRGGTLWFERGPPPVWRSLPALSGHLVVLDTGEAGDTAALVAGVAARGRAAEPTLSRIGDLVRQASTRLHAPAQLGPLLTENHELLASLGVSTPQLDALVALALDHGAHGAKLAGAGGGGVVLCLTDDPERIVLAARDQGVAAFPAVPWEAP